jgi:branched-chain amino acid transport system permease protein
MSFEPLRRFVDGDAPLLSWQRWDSVKSSELFVLVASAVFVVVFPWLFVRSPVISGYVGGYQSLAKTTVIWSIFAIGFNLLLGYTGLLSFGHAIFWGGAGYMAGWVALYSYGHPILMIVGGAVFAVVLAALVAPILLRLSTVYFAIVSLAMGQTLFWLSREPLNEWTGGENGLPRLTVEPIFGDTLARDPLPGILGTLMGSYMYFLIAIVFVLVVVFVHRVLKSPYGLIFRAIRENETRTSFVGLNVWRYKFAAFLMSAGVSGLAGGLLTADKAFVGIRRLWWSASGDVVVMTVIGGLGTLFGPVIGAIVYLWFNGVVDGFAVVGKFWLMILAFVFTAIVWRYPDGTFGALRRLGRAIRSLGGGSS